MATEKNIVMKEFNGTDYDTLYPKTIGTQVDGIFTAEQTLTNNTLALYGLGTNAVPDDVFAWLGKYNLHWWRRRSYFSGYSEKQTALTGRLQVVNASSGTATTTISYSTSINIDQSTGVVSLENPSTISLKSNDFVGGGNSNALTLRGKYILNAYTSTSTVYYINSDATFAEWHDSGNKDYEGYISGAKSISSQFAIQYGSWEYLQSSDRNAYPDSGITDGYEYVYLGIPFENAADPPIEIEVVEYTGTGENKTVSITFQNTPRAVLILPNNNSSSYICWWIFNSTKFCSTYTTGKYTALFDVSTNTLSWSGTTYAERWGNSSGTKHIAIAIL